MALKPDRIELATDISFFMNTVAERGGIATVVVTSSGSGVAMDDAGAVVAYNAIGSGARPIGLLLNDVVNYDLTRQHINWYKDEMQVGGKVVLLRNGQATTNYITAGAVPGPGLDAYVNNSGYVGVTASGGTKIGQWLSAKDADGYAKLSVNIT
jgi:hypothetical protein